MLTIFNLLLLLLPLISCIENSIKLSDGVFQQGDIVGNQIDYFYFNIAEDMKQLYVSLTLCELEGDSTLELFYLNEEEIDNDIRNWESVSIYDTKKTYKDEEIEHLSELALEDYLFGIMKIILEIQSTSNKVYFAIKSNKSDSSKIHYGITVSTKEFINDVKPKVVATFLDADHTSASIVVNNTGIETNFDDYRMAYFKFDSKRRLNTYCNLVYNNRSTILEGNKGKLNHKVKFIDTTDKEDNEILLYEAFYEKLEANTQYVTYLINIKKNITYLPIYFQTRTKDQQCYLAHNLPFCDQVYYSIPVGGQLNDQSKSETYLEEQIRVNKAIQIYDQRAKDVFANFTNLVDQYDCGKHIYSPVRKCGDCLLAYKTWLCSITIPRCTDINKDDRFIAERIKGDNIKNFVYEEIGVEQFLEVKPCADLCHYVIQSCPAAFKFNCPLIKNTLEKTYFPGKGPGGSARKQIQEDLKDYYSSPFSSIDSLSSFITSPQCNLLLSNTENLFFNPPKISNAFGLSSDIKLTWLGFIFFLYVCL